MKKSEDMNDKEKMLVLKYLCWQLPYGVFVEDKIVGRSFDKDGNVVYSPVVYDWSYHPNIGKVKPYLRPMSSMTEEERNELDEKGIYIDDDFDICHDAYEGRNISLKYVVSEYVDWLNAHYFDYRGLIEMGLALEAIEGMYNN